jgi:hypothetical protein
MIRRCGGNSVAYPLVGLGGYRPFTLSVMVRECSEFEWRTQLVGLELAIDNHAVGDSSQMQ